jgi:hypothetical protein
LAAKKDPRLERYGLKGYNQPKRTPDHPTKKGVVLAKEGDTVKLIRFGDQTMTTAGKPSKSDTAKDKARRASFKARHAKNIARGKLSGSYWSSRELW